MFQIFKDGKNKTNGVVQPAMQPQTVAPVATSTVPVSSGFNFTQIGTVGDNVVVATIKLRNLISAMKNGFLVDYEKNRGTGRLNQAKARKIAMNYDVNKLGTITVANFGDGIFKKADAHHRSGGILIKNDGLNGISPFTNAELEQDVSLQIIQKEDFIRVYSGLNANNGHGSRAKVLNTDLGLGSLIDQILSLQQQESSVKEKFFTTIARCVYAYIGLLDKPIKESSYAEISLDRKFVSEDAGLSKEEFDVKVSKAEKEIIAKALDYVNETYAQFKKLNNLSTNKKSNTIKLNATGRSLMSNASFFGFLLWDKLSGREYVTYLSPKNLALRITEKDAQIERQAKDILNSVSRDNAAEKIVAYICTKKRK